MTHVELRNLYDSRQQVFQSELQKTRRKINDISSLRLGVAILFACLLYLSFRETLFFYCLPAAVVVFIILVRRHAALFTLKKHLETMILVQRNELSGLEGDWSHNGSGSEFVSSNHSFSHDLDVFGEGSLFQCINRSNTRGGKQLLAERLTSRPGSAQEIYARQQAVSELAKKHDFRHEVQSLSMQTDEQPGDQRQLEQWLSRPGFVYGKPFYRTTLNVFPIITVGLVTAAFFVDGLTGLAVLSAGLQWVFLAFHLKRVNEFHQYINHKKAILNNYAGILYFIRKENHTCGLMQSLGARAAEADIKLNKLASLVSAFDARLNSMTNLFVNSLLLYDLQCVYRLERWKAENAARVPEWLEVIRETEVLCSLGSFAFNNPAFTFPHINDQQKLSARGLGHPMIAETERVVNDVDIHRGHSIMIITGANMAGKSTFLRAIGINVVLAHAGAPVCAESLDCPLIGLRTGMRTADSLKENQSYFYAELDRLKSIMDELREGTALLILLDEILKGTNSTDKQAGSIALVKQLIDRPCLVVVATHDLALGDLEKLYPDRVGNYSFEANIVNEQLFFDYKLKRGVAQKMNATFLMKKMGIITP